MDLTDTGALTSSATGLATGLTLIVAIGSQNAFVLRQGLKREHVGPVVAVCAVSDLVLIVAGVGGIGFLVERAGWLLDLVRWLGVAFLVAYGLVSLRRAWHSESLSAEDAPPASSLRRSLLTALALTWLNPHVYLDTVLFLGSVGAQQGPDLRWWFALGASLGSIVWFTGLGYGASALAPLLARPRSWQVLDALIGVVMITLAVMLARG